MEGSEGGPDEPDGLPPGPKVAADHEASSLEDAAVEEQLRNQEQLLGQRREACAKAQADLEAKKVSFMQKSRDHVQTLQAKISKYETQIVQIKDLVRERDEAHKQETQELRTELGTTRDKLSAAEEEGARSRQELEAKMGQVVAKAKEHMKQMQGRLEGLENESKTLSEQVKEKEESLRQQNDKVQKYKQLMGQANSRLEDNDGKTKDLEEALKKSQSQRVKLQQQMGSMEQFYMLPPSREEVERMGGVALVVEEEGGEAWCLIHNNAPKEASVLDDNDGDADPDSPKNPSSHARQRWWPLAQLDLDDTIEVPVPLQRRWKGETSALRQQMVQFKEKAERLEEEFERYRQKAHAALSASATNSQELHMRERKMEQLGEQLQTMAMDLQRAQDEKAKTSQDLSETKRSLQEAVGQRNDIEMQLEAQVKEAEQRLAKSIAEFNEKRDVDIGELQVKAQERENNLHQELEKVRTLKDSLEEEAETLRTRLANRPNAPVLPVAPVMPIAEPELVSPSREQKTEETEDTEDKPRTEPASDFTEEPVLTKNLRETAGDAEAAPKLNLSRHSPDSRMAPEVAESEEDGPKGERPRLPPQAYSLHTSTAWQDLVNLRSQVRHLEISLEEEKHGHDRTRKQCDMLKAEVREMEMQQRLQKTVGQSTQMEYIRNVFRRFIESMPVAAKAEHEGLVPVLMTFFQFPDDEVKNIQQKRLQLGQQGQGFWGKITGR